MAVAELRQANQQDPRVVYLLAVGARGQGRRAEAKEAARRRPRTWNALSNTYGYVRGKAKAMVTVPKKDVRDADLRAARSSDEAAPYYSRYIDRISSDDVIGVLESELREATERLRGVSEERSAYRYAPDKWSFREALSHVNDTERVFLARAFWFGRGFEGPLPSFDQDVSARAARADDVPWARHVDEFAAIRAGTIAFFKNLPAEAWPRTGVASDNPVSVRALAYIIAGHLAHHLAVLEERYS